MENLTNDDRCKFQNDNMRNEKGSITIFVLLSMIFFVIILSGVYIASLNKQKASLNYVEKIANNYDADADEVYDNIYSSVLTVYPGGNKYIDKAGATREITAPEQTYKVTYSTNGEIDCNEDTVTAKFDSWTLIGVGSLTDTEAEKTTYTFGDGNATLTANYGANSQITLPTTKKAGYEFKGWYTEEDGGVKIGNEGDSYAPTKNITLYAQWEEIKYTLTIEPNGGTWDDNTQNSTRTGAYGTTELIEQPTRVGYEFAGWTLDGSGSIETGTGTRTYTYGAGDGTITAQWTVIPLSGTLSITGSIHLTASETYSYSGVTGVNSVAWSSSNTSVATISTDGKVTLVGSGSTTLTAIVTGYDGKTTTATKTIYVYAVFKNKSNGKSLYVFSSSAFSSHYSKNPSYTTSTTYTFLGIKSTANSSVTNGYQIRGGNTTMINSLAKNYWEWPYEDGSFSKFSTTYYTSVGSYYIVNSSTYYRYLKATIGGDYYTSVNGIK